ncbi:MULTISPECIES: TonB-dependent receptor [Bacteroides]|uniref:SusC/RagA family TonB-linked outer membrane protein n=3 Tax=Bacteroides TaxID=816 RepID=I9SA61_9BACE|nr:TonB-dependent receptor [Bacteroides nordii]EIY52288.1 SusC/RagA family TonB-linked outer membrane protein [Bacteroides nordii CL02T12C05]MCE8466128.1 TonB-dependent receptor [Bacteroides nordii]MCG4768659.1 TonB-dependent receptor [Bacteroides nordii]RHB33761.1 SusC/RagA family TonB-linked outer membrane protein [Bacteroides nordii]UYU47743.1 TonB-dependent receptor [Bacteroides nordii]
MTREKHKFVICTMLLILFLWGTSIVSIAQEVKKNTVTINVKNESVEKVLKRINKETSLNFFYDPAILSKASSVTLNVKDMPLQEVLNMLSVQTGLNFQRINNTISVNWETNSKQPIQSPKEKITGTIKDNNGDPVIGASIQIKNTGIGTITDYNGQFSLSNVPENGILIISYIGYDTEEIPVNKKKNLQIVMKENTKQLEEIVVVAYGTAKKSSFTGSAEVVKQDRIEKRVVADVSKALEGTVAGVQSTSGSGQPGSGASMVIRGFGSISASNTPLYVVDGVPFDGALNTINPNDIESVTVLKDASAGALYGSRGANGVVMITTKRGERDDNQISINLKANWGISSRAIPKYETVNEAEYLELAFEAYKNELIYTEGIDPLLAGTQAIEVMKGMAKGVLGYNEEYNPFNMPLQELINPITGKINPTAQLKYHEDWKDELSNHNPLRQEYQLSVTGGNKKTQYMISMGYLDEVGLLQTTEFERYTGRVNIDTQAKKWFKTGFNASFAQTSTNYNSASGSVISNLWYTSQIMAPIYPVYEHNTDGSLKTDANGNKIYDYGKNRIALANSNAIALLHEDKENNTRDNLSARTYIQLSTNDDEYGIFKGFSLMANLGLDYFNTHEMSYSNPYTGNAATTAGSLTKAVQRQLSYTFNQLLTYQRNIRSHSLDVMIGHEYYELKQQFLGAQKTGFPFGGLYELSAAATLSGASSQTDKYAIESFLSRVNYNFAQKYYFSASFRTDGSSRFHKDSRWGKFWSLGTSWRISEESFMKKYDWVNNLTLKASFGSQGNDNIGSYYAYQSLYNMGLSNGSLNGAGINSLENKDLKWEKNENLNIGIEARLFNRLSLTAEFFNKHTKDLLLNMPKATSSGFDAYPANIGSMRNMGLDVTATVDILKNSDLKWTLIAMGSHIRNKILKLADKPEIISGSNIFKEGETVNSFYLPISAGVDPLTGNQLYWVDHDKNSNIVSKYKTDDVTLTANSREIVGNRIPDLYGSITNDFSYKGIDFSILTTYSIGGEMLDGVYGSMMNVGYKGYVWHKNALRRWQQPGDITDIPKIMWDQQLRVTDKDLINASYFAIKNITLGYTFPKDWLTKIKMDNIRVYATANNLALFSHLKGMDPQYNFTGTVGYTYTPSRTYSIGIDIKF